MLVCCCVLLLRVIFCAQQGGGVPPLSPLCRVLLPPCLKFLWRQGRVFTGDMDVAPTHGSYITVGMDVVPPICAFFHRVADVNMAGDMDVALTVYRIGVFA